MTLSLYRWIDVGMALEVRCVDWSHNSEQLDAKHEFEIIPAHVYGRVVRVYEDGLCIAHQTFFEHAQVRQVTSIPWGCILGIKLLVEGDIPSAGGA